MDGVVEIDIVQESQDCAELASCSNARGASVLHSARWHREVCNGVRCMDVLQ